MKNIRSLQRIVWVAFVIFAFAGVTRAAETQAIDALIQRAGSSASDLTAADRQIISRFVNDSIDELLAAQQGEEMVAARSAISSRMLSDKSSKYRLAFADLLEQSLLGAADYIRGWEAGERKRKVQANLVILAAQLQSPKLVDFAAELLTSDNQVIRYWAVKALTGSRLLAQFNDPITADRVLTDKVVDALNRYIGPNTSSEVLAIIAEFAAGLENANTSDMLLKIVDTRLQEYEDWTVRYEKADAAILEMVAAKAAKVSSPQKARLLGSFAQLYSYVMQRYILGQQMLSDENISYLISTMAQVEHTVLRSLLGRSQNSIRTAIEQKDLNQLKQEHDSLFGSTAQKGRIDFENSLDYGTDHMGRKLSGPKALTPPPGRTSDTESENA